MFFTQPFVAIFCFQSKVMRDARRMPYERLMAAEGKDAARKQMCNETPSHLLFHTYPWIIFQNGIEWQ